MAGAPKQEQDADVVLPIDPENAYGKAFRSICLEAARGRMPAASCDLRSTMGAVRHEVLADAMMAGLLTVRREEAGMDLELCRLC